MINVDLPGIIHDDGRPVGDFERFNDRGDIFAN